jgi:hypothetical protein
MLLIHSTPRGQYALNRNTKKGVSPSESSPPPLPRLHPRPRRSHPPQSPTSLGPTPSPARRHRPQSRFVGVRGCFSSDPHLRRFHLPPAWAANEQAGRCRAPAINRAQASLRGCTLILLLVERFECAEQVERIGHVELLQV